MASGEMAPPQFTAFIGSAFQNLAVFSVDGSLHYICMDWRHVTELLTAAQNIYGELKNLCVWVKDNGGMGSLYRSQHELVFVFKHGRGAHRNNAAPTDCPPRRGGRTSYITLRGSKGWAVVG